MDIKLNGIYENQYVVRLSIYDHIRELTTIEGMIKVEKNSPNRCNDRLIELEEHCMKELTDLYILIGNHTSEDIIYNRLEKFREKMRE